jgi:Arc/MetJ-type ribon-helix-helix transcriptional regulator
MPAERGGNTTQGLTSSVCAVVPTTDKQDDTEVVGSDDNAQNANTIEYPEGESHGVTVYVQVNDSNELYQKLTDAQRRLNNEREDNADSNNPHFLGEIDASWTDGIDEIGFFSSRQEYGKQTEHGFTNYYGQYLNLYADVEKGQIANNPAKRQIRVHKRSDDLTYPDGNKYNWPAGWISGERREGSLIEIQASYVQSPGEAIAHAFELIEETDLLSYSELSRVKQPISETVRFRGLESHHRVHTNHEHDAIETLRDSARLVGTEGDGRIEGNWQKGHHQIYGFDTNAIRALGHDAGISWTYGGDEYSDTIERHYLKCYRHKSAERFSQTDPRAHPKIEVKARGAYPGPAWNAVKRHLDSILNAHTADYAGIPASALIEDKYHDGSNQEVVRTITPRDYRVNLKDYFKSTGLKKDIISLIVNNRSDSAKDILYTVIRLGRPVMYDELKSETGLTKRTIRKWVKKLEDLKIVTREMDQVVVDHQRQPAMFVQMSDFVRNHLRGFLEKLKPVGDIKRAIQRRKYERERKRESDTETSTQPRGAAMTDGGEDTNPTLHGQPQPNLTASEATHAHPETDTDPPPD